MGVVENGWWVWWRMGNRSGGEWVLDEVENGGWVRWRIGDRWGVEWVMRVVWRMGDGWGGEWVMGGVEVPRECCILRRGLYLRPQNRTWVCIMPLAKLNVSVPN